MMNRNGMTSRPRRRQRPLVLAAAMVGLTVGVAGCGGPTIADLPLPGNGVGGDTIELTVQFDEALNLSRGAAVKVNGVASGKVRTVAAKDFKAIATVEVKRSARIRAGAEARLRYTTPLGELFVDVTNPDTGRVLRDGQSLDPRRSTTAPTVEDALSSASLLVNGGGLNQLQIVTDQLNDALGGREETVRNLLTEINRFLIEANRATPDLDRALNSLAEVSTIMAANRATVRAALRDLPPAARVLRENTPELTALLEQVRRFSATANDVVTATRSDLIQIFDEVGPVLQEFLNARSKLGPSLRALTAASEVLDRVAPGDYGNLQITLLLNQLSTPQPDGTMDTVGTSLLGLRSTMGEK